MLTLLKQARASGLGVVLATQNPADLDYKGLANTGTWFLGRLQTERDKMRVLEGLEGAATATGAAFEASRMDQVLAGLPSRVFLAHNVHEDAPLLFQTRWAMSYLRGPLTRDQIQRLMAERKSAAPPDASRVAAREEGVAAAAAAAATTGGSRPIVPPEIEERFLPAVRAPGDRSRLVYRPHLLARARLHFVRAASGIDRWEERHLMAFLAADGEAPAWGAVASSGAAGPTLEDSARHEADFQPLPAVALRARSWASWRKQLEAELYRDHRLVLWRSAALGAQSSPGESEDDFRARAAHLARERRDREVEELRRRYAPKLAALEEKVRRGEEKIRQEESQLGHQRLDTAISIGATLVGALFGRKLASVANVTRARSTLRGAGRAAREKEDVARAGRVLETAREDSRQLEQELARDIAALERTLDAAALDLERIELPPRKTDVSVDSLILLWTPWQVDAAGIAEPLVR
jgi:hypothetical protein